MFAAVYSIGYGKYAILTYDSFNTADEAGERLREVLRSKNMHMHPPIREYESKEELHSYLDKLSWYNRPMQREDIDSGDKESDDREWEHIQDEYMPTIIVPCPARTSWRLNDNR